MRALLPLAAVPGSVLAEPVTATDGFGREVTAPEPPERIMCFLVNCAKELAFLGGPVPVGLSAGVHDVMAEAGTYGPAIEGARASTTPTGWTSRRWRASTPIS